MVYFPFDVPMLIHAKDRKKKMGPGGIMALSAHLHL